MQVVSCPALGFAQLPANGTVSDSGTWDHTKPDITVRVPVGTFTLVVDNRRFSFPLHVVAHRGRGIFPVLTVVLVGSTAWRVLTRDA